MKAKKIHIGIKDLADSLKDFAATWKRVVPGKKTKKEKGNYF